MRLSWNWDWIRGLHMHYFFDVATWLAAFSQRKNCRPTPALQRGNGEREESYWFSLRTHHSTLNVGCDEFCCLSMHAIHLPTAYKSTMVSYPQSSPPFWLFLPRSLHIYLFSCLQILPTCTVLSTSCLPSLPWFGSMRWFGQCAHSPPTGSHYDSFLIFRDAVDGRKFHFFRLSGAFARSSLKLKPPISSKLTCPIGFMDNSPFGLAYWLCCPPRVCVSCANSCAPMPCHVNTCIYIFTNYPSTAGCGWWMDMFLLYQVVWVRMDKYIYLS